MRKATLTALVVICVVVLALVLFVSLQRMPIVCWARCVVAGRPLTRSRQKPVANVRTDWVDPRMASNGRGLPEVTHRTYFDIEIDGEYVGRIVMVFSLISTYVAAALLTVICRACSGRPFPRQLRTFSSCARANVAPSCTIPGTVPRVNDESPPPC